MPSTDAWVKPHAYSLSLNFWCSLLLTTLQRPAKPGPPATIPARTGPSPPEQVSKQWAHLKTFCSILHYSWFQTFAVFWMLYAFFWIIPWRLNFICRRFGTLCPFQLRRRIGMKDDWVWESLVCSSPLCFSNTLGSFVGCSQYTASLFIYVYILLYVTWTTCFDLSIL